jgi:hypothetical protein
MLGFDTYYVHRWGQLASHLTLKIRDSKYLRNVKNTIKLYKAQQPKQNELDVNNESYDILDTVPSTETA